MRLLIPIALTFLGASCAGLKDNPETTAVLVSYAAEKAAREFLADHPGNRDTLEAAALWLRSQEGAEPRGSLSVLLLAAMPGDLDAAEKRALAALIDVSLSTVRPAFVEPIYLRAVADGLDAARAGK